MFNTYKFKFVILKHSHACFEIDIHKYKTRNQKFKNLNNNLISCFSQKFALPL